MQVERGEREGEGFIQDLIGDELSARKLRGGSQDMAPRKTGRGCSRGEVFSSLNKKIHKKGDEPGRLGALLAILGASVLEPDLDLRV